ncbi:MAG: fibronectin type III domain-containing protein [Clostridiales bacterium]|nr:fibronectin type III domain-containing protein [Clostridiales bacterium]
MKAEIRTWKLAIAIIMSVCMVFTMVPTISWASEYSGENGDEYAICETYDNGELIGMDENNLSKNGKTIDLGDYWSPISIRLAVKDQQSGNYVKASNSQTPFTWLANGEAVSSNDVFVLTKGLLEEWLGGENSTDINIKASIDSEGNSGPDFTLHIKTELVEVDNWQTATKFEPESIEDFVVVNEDGQETDVLSIVDGNYGMKFGISADPTYAADFHNEYFVWENDDFYLPIRVFSGLSPAENIPKREGKTNLLIYENDEDYDNGQLNITYASELLELDSQDLVYGDINFNLAYLGEKKEDSGEPAETHSHSMCGASCEGHINMSGTHDSENWTAWNGTGALSGYKYLTKDIELTDSVSINGNTHLCLNGHTISFDTDDKKIITVPEETEFTICDCCGNGKIVSEGNMPAILSYGTLTVYGGTIEAKNATTLESYKGIANIMGGKILGINGVIASYDDTILNIYGGEIIDTGTADFDIQNYNEINIYGGKVGCIAAAENVSIYGGEVKKVCMPSNCYISGGKIDTITCSPSGSIHACDKEKKNYYSGEKVTLKLFNDATEGVLVTDVPDKATADLFETRNAKGELVATEYNGSEIIYNKPKGSGAINDKTNWSVWNDGTLIITGNGNTPDYTSSDSAVPWSAYDDQIKKVVIDEKVTGIGKYTFAENKSIDTLEIKAENVMLGNYCFKDCDALTTIDFGIGTVVPGAQVFANCDSLEKVTIPAGVSMTKEPDGNGIGTGSGMFRGCSKLANVIVECAYVGPYMFESDYALKTVTFTNEDTEFYSIDNDGEGYPFNNEQDMSFTLIGHECSFAHVIANYEHPKLAIDFVQIEGDTTKHDEVTDSAKTETCDEDGLTGGSHCSECGLVLQKQTVIPATGHVYGELIPEVQATCEKEGVVAHYQCSKCNKCFDTEKKEMAEGSWIISATGHELAHYKQAAGYLRNGCEYDICNVCLNKLNYKTLAGYSTNYVKKFKVKKGKKRFTAKWKKQSKKNRKNFTGYQIRYSTNPSMANARYTTAKKTAGSKVIKGLAKNTKYYVQVRSYYGSYYASWSAVKSVKTK